MAGRLGVNLRTHTDTREFAAWMTSGQRRIFILCQRMLQDPGEADSATQDTFLKAWQALQRQDARILDDPDKWLTRIAINTCLDRLRSRKWQFWRRRPKASDEAALLGSTPSTGPGADEQVFANQIADRLSQALNRLTVRQRSVFTLRHYEELSLAEIGDLLNLDVGTVKAHLFRATNKLREELKDLYFREYRNPQGGANDTLD